MKNQEKFYMKSHWDHIHLKEHIILIQQLWVQQWVPEEKTLLLLCAQQFLKIIALISKMLAKT